MKTAPCTAITVFKKYLTPEQIAEGHRICNDRLNDYYAKMAAKQKRDRRVSMAINELESTGEC